MHLIKQAALMLDSCFAYTVQSGRDAKEPACFQCFVVDAYRRVDVQ